MLSAHHEDVSTDSSTSLRMVDESMVIDLFCSVFILSFFLFSFFSFFLFFFLYFFCRRGKPWSLCVVSFLFINDERNLRLGHYAV